MDSERSLDDVMRKIRGLLRKAEATPYEEEAIAFLTKAQEMMYVYAVDEETVWANEPDRIPTPVVNTIPIPRIAGNKWQRVMLRAIADSNRCMMWSEGDEAYVAGYPNDALVTELIFTSVKLQMNMVMAMELAKSGITGQKQKSFKHSFIEGYALRIYKRFKEMQDNSTGSGRELVLHRTARIEDYMKNTLGIELVTRTIRTTGTDGRARNAGSRAADKADLSSGTNRLNNRRQLTA